MSKPYIFGVVPARGGSQGLIQKNTRQLAGLPLLVHTLRAAQASQLLTRTIVSTEDGRIRALAREYGGEVPFNRPEHLAGEDISPVAVALHALGWLEAAENIQPDIVVLLSPGAPLRTAEDIDNTLQLLLDNPRADSVISVSPPLNDNPYLAYTLKGERLEPLFKAPLGVQRRHLALPYIRNGAVLAARRDAFIRNASFYGRTMLHYEMPPERGVYVEDDLGLALAEFFMGRRAAE